MRIVYFDIDCLRPDHLGCYGYERPTSPTLDWVAAEGVRFDHYYCANSPCLPSRAALLTGRFGINNGVVTHRQGAGSGMRIRETLYGGPAPENQLLWRRIRENGVDTVGFSNFAMRHCAGWYGLGWTEFHTPNLKTGSESAEEVTEPVLRWLRHSGTRDDYFLYVNYWDPHRIYTIDPSWAERFKGHPVPQAWPDEETIRAHQSITGPFTATGQFRDGKSRTPLMPDAVRSRRDFEHMITGYDATIAYTDHHVKIVLDELDRQGVLDETAIIISGDHGDAFGEHGIYTDHVCADEAIHRIVLIVRWPGLAPAGGLVSGLFYNVDLSATLCELTGGSVPDHYDGRSLARHLQGEKGFEREYLVWEHGLYTLQRAVRTRRHLMIRTYDDHGYPFEPVALYDMLEDPYQTRNIVDECPEIASRLDGHLAEWLQEQFSSAARSGPCAGPDPLMEELCRRRG